MKNFHWEFLGSLSFLPPNIFPDLYSRLFSSIFSHCQCLNGTINVLFLYHSTTSHQRLLLEIFAIVRISWPLPCLLVCIYPWPGEGCWSYGLWLGALSIFFITASTSLAITWSYHYLYPSNSDIWSNGGSKGLLVSGWHRILISSCLSWFVCVGSVGHHIQRRGNLIWISPLLPTSPHAGHPFCTFCQLSFSLITTVLPCLNYSIATLLSCCNMSAWGSRCSALLIALLVLHFCIFTFYSFSQNTGVSVL